MELSLAVLGSVEATWGDQPLAFSTSAARALIAYLAVEAGRTHRREHVAALLWSDHPPAAAYTNLRQTIARVRKALPEPGAVLDVTRTTLRLARSAVTLDLAGFEELVAACAVHPHADLHACPACTSRLERAEAQYRGEFLHGLFLPHGAPFEEWALLRRESLHRQVLDVLATLARGCEAAGDHVGMRRHAARQVALEPWSERGHAQLMRALAAGGRRAAALAQYHTCCRVLRTELGVAPSAELTSLYGRIRSGGPPALRWPAAEVPPPDHVPEPGAVYGRAVEAERLARWLVEDRGRVSAVLGLGGVGKTTLAAAVVRDTRAAFDTVIWRSLRNAPPLDEVLGTVLTALSGWPPADLPTRLDPRLALLLELLGRGRYLVVLDDLDSVLSARDAGAYRAGYEPYGQLVGRVAAGHHTSGLLLVSRERPRELDRMDLDARPANTLLLRGLERVGSLAWLGTHGLAGQPEAAHLLAQRYSGNPLALGLVALTIRQLFSGDIAAFLDAGAPIVDDMRAVLDAQHARLSALEAEILERLSDAESEPADLPALRARLSDPPSARELIEALNALERRSLLLEVDGRFTLPHLVATYVTGRSAAKITPDPGWR